MTCPLSWQQSPRLAPGERSLQFCLCEAGEAATLSPATEARDPGGGKGTRTPSAEVGRGHAMLRLGLSSPGWAFGRNWEQGGNPVGVVPRAGAGLGLPGALLSRRPGAMAVGRGARGERRGAGTCGGQLRDASSPAPLSPRAAVAPPTGAVRVVRGSRERGREGSRQRLRDSRLSPWGPWFSETQTGFPSPFHRRLGVKSETLRLVGDTGGTREPRLFIPDPACFLSAAAAAVD